MTASVAKEPLCFVHKQICPSLWITVSTRSLSPPPTNVIGCTWGWDRVPACRCWTRRQGQMSELPRACGWNKNEGFIYKTTPSPLWSRIYTRRGGNNQCKMDVQSHKDLLKKSQERNRTEWIREHAFPWIYLISPRGRGLALAVTWWVTWPTFG